MLSYTVAARFFGTKTRRFVNLTYFNSWTPPNAYWFGFLCADGCVTSKSRNKHIYITSLALKCSDLSHVWFRLRNFDVLHDHRQKFQTLLLCPPQYNKQSLLSFPHRSRMSPQQIQISCLANVSSTRLIISFYSRLFWWGWLFGPRWNRWNYYSNLGHLFLFDFSPRRSFS